MNKIIIILCGILILVNSICAMNYSGKSMMCITNSSSNKTCINSFDVYEMNSTSYVIELYPAHIEKFSTSLVLNMAEILIGIGALGVIIIAALFFAKEIVK